MKSLSYGIASIIIGIVCFIYWWPHLIVILKGLLPLGLVVFGLLALSTGISVVGEKTAHTEKDEEEPKQSSIKTD